MSRANASVAAALARASSPSGLLATGLIVSIALLPVEIDHYRQVLPSYVSELGLVLTAALLGKTLAVVGSGIAMALGLSWSLRGAWRVAARGAGHVWVILCATWLWADLQVHLATGNHATEYLAFLANPDTLHWAGQGLAPGATLGRALLAALPIWMGALTLAAFSTRLTGFPIVVALVWGLTLTGSLLVQRASGEPRALGALHDQLPFAWHLGFDESSDPLEAVEARARELYRSKGGAIHRIPTVDFEPPDIELPNPLDVVLVVVESLRADALDPETMPYLWKLSERGVRSKRHYSGGFASQYGFFSLMYAATPLDYYEAIEAGVPPVLPNLMLRAGYRTQLVTGAALQWMGMTQFMGWPHFQNVKAFVDGKNYERDRQVSKYLQKMILKPIGQPRFLVVYPMSTHWPYTHPAQWSIFGPEVETPDALSPAMRRQAARMRNSYRNSALYLDSLLGNFLKRLDLERTVVLVTGDHGESIYHDGTVGHNSRLSEAQLATPFLMAGAGIPRGVSLDGPTSHIDIVPTLLARLGADADSLRRFPGRDLLAEPARPAMASSVARRGLQRPRQQLAITTADHRFGVALHPKDRSLDLLGVLDEDGQASGAMSADEASQFLVAFESLLDRYVDLAKLRRSRAAPVAKPASDL